MMREYEDFCGVQVISYCIMSNHFHLLVEVPPKKKDEVKMGTLMDSLKGARVPIARKGNNVVLEIMVQKEGAKKDGEYIVAKKVATRRWSHTSSTCRRRFKAISQYVSTTGSS